MLFHILQLPLRRGSWKDWEIRIEQKSCLPENIMSVWARLRVNVVVTFFFTTEPQEFVYLCDSPVTEICAAVSITCWHLRSSYYFCFQISFWNNHPAVVYIALPLNRLTSIKNNLGGKASIAIYSPDVLEPNSWDEGKSIVAPKFSFLVFSVAPLTYQNRAFSLFFYFFFQNNRLMPCEVELYNDFSILNTIE